MDKILTENNDNRMIRKKENRQMKAEKMKT